MANSNTESKTESREFQAEVKNLLSIVINSLYTERDIFLRELISNGADALEKYHHQSLLEKEVFDKEAPLEINISVNDKDHTLTITDSGIGMTREELEADLGTIAHSGSNSFIRNLTEAAKKDVSLIGEFGVGFYAAFMAAKRVIVQSRSFRMNDEGHEWSSDGEGGYTISACPGLHRGTKIILELKDDAHDYANEQTIKRIIKQYSNFVPFPIKVGAEKVNTIQAIWTRNKNEIKEEEYNEFYKFIGNAVDEPGFRLHFSADAPLSINALLFIPQENFERMGFGRVQPGVNLYCQKVLIEQHSETILPEWLRFVKGVIDSEDLPLNISRQALQDNALVAKIKKVVTKRFLKFLGEQAKADPETYDDFWWNFGMYLKEGATTDFEHRDNIAKLMRFESSKSEKGKLISLSEYVDRMKEYQNEIYYINGPSREAIESGPYIETFKKHDIEIIYTTEPIDDFVFSHLGQFDGKKLVSADRADLHLPDEKEEKPDKDETSEEQPLDAKAAETLIEWIKGVLADKVKDVLESKRLVNSPAIIVNPDQFMTSSMERIMRATNQDLQNLGNKNLEINTKHTLIKNLSALKEKDELFAKEIVEQIYDNALIQAGLMVEPRTMVDRTYMILERASRIG
ncbi:MAG: molecular chaperone HtpG [Thermodesulfobacteriota bacterium]|nr:molecular chaperone HtpG [Thermodesulfobacteriota bacterium]